ncbi:MAG: hypothetical protein ACRDHL_00035, partial [Candidatus Promineifilaceae bacterium]
MAQTGGPAPVPVSQSAADSVEPSLAADSAGGLHVVWCEPVTLEACDTLFYNGSADGVSWSTPVDIIWLEGERAGHPSLAAGADGRLHLVWSNERQVLYSQAAPASAGAA